MLPRMKMISSILLLLILSSCLCAATFVVNVTQSSYQAEENHNITLEWTFTSKTQGSWRELSIYCSLISDGKESVLYRLDEGVEISDSQHDQFSGRVQSDKDVLREGRIRLHVSRLRTEDSGQYVCDVKTEDGSNNAECRLNVFVKISAVPGQNVFLPCRLPNNKPAVVVEWTRPDLEPEYVLLFKDDQSDPENQHPSFRKRVELQDRRMKDGDVSLLLRNVTTNDSGKYECRVFKREATRRKRRTSTSDPIEIVFLDVAPPTENKERKEDGSRNKSVGLITVAVLMVSLIIGFIIRYVIKTKEEEAEDEQITKLRVSVEDRSGSEIPNLHPQSSTSSII